MRKIATVAAAMLLTSTAALAAEDSPDRSHVKLAKIPQQCLTAGSALKDDVKYTCTKVDTSEVWNDLELRKFDKDIFEAYQQAQPVDPPRTRIGLVVRQDTVQTREVMQPQAVTTEMNEVAFVERRDGYKYRYTRR